MTTIDPALVTQFSEMVHVAAQQKSARYRPYIKPLMMTGDLLAYDGLGTVEMRELQGRSPKVVFDDIEHTRRRLNRKRFTCVLPIDKSDVRGMLTDPRNKLTLLFVNMTELSSNLLLRILLQAEILQPRLHTPTTAASLLMQPLA